jgi:acetyl esterase/lipase
MTRSLALLTAISVMCFVAVAQDVADHPRASASSGSQLSDKLTVQTIELSIPSGVVNAYAYIPQAGQRLPGIVFSHSTVRYSDSTADLLPLARDLAREGAAVIVVDGTMLWPPQDQNTNRERGDVTIAALGWMLKHANVDPGRVAYVGPQFRDPGSPDVLRSFNEKDGVQYSAWVPLGEPLNPGNMTVLPKSEGKAMIERFLRGRIGLGRN